MGSQGNQRFCGRSVTEDNLSTIRKVVAEFPGLSRVELAGTICELIGWLRPTGFPMVRECVEWLEGLESQRLLNLPMKRSGRKKGEGIKIPYSDQGEPGEAVLGTVRDISPIHIERVLTQDHRRLWRELVGRYHYLGHAVPFGAHLRYLVWASKPNRVVVGCVQASSPAWRMAARDQWIGWDDETRGRNLQRILCNSRFLILPWVQVKNLASTVLSRIARQVRKDWKDQYGIEPYLLETLVDGERFEGTCYRAAGWAFLGQTTGRGRMDWDHRTQDLRPKRLFVLPLVVDAPRRLRGETGPEERHSMAFSL